MQLVIGYGSLVRGDDGLGQVIAQAVAARRPDVHTITHVQLMPEYAEPISAAERVFFIDAGIEGEPGTITCEAIAPAAEESADSAFAHSLTPPALLSAARDLYGRVPEAYLITVVGASFGYAVTLSPDLAQRLPGLVETVLGWIENTDLTPDPSPNSERGASGDPRFAALVQPPVAMNSAEGGERSERGGSRVGISLAEL